MILILSDSQDYTTSMVIDWLTFYKKVFVLLNAQQSVRLIKLDDDNNAIIQSGNTIVNFKDVSAIWFRKGYLNITFDLLNNTSLYNRVNQFLRQENEYLTNYLYKLLLEKPSLGNFMTANPDKLEMIRRAKAFRLKVPNSLITSSKSELINFKNKNGQIITKSIGAPPMIYDDNIVITAYTELVTDAFIEKLADTFPVSLFQQKIEKKYELRIFYLNGDFFPMAIFSQLDPQTSVDFRKYNRKKPNRTTPFLIDEPLKRKLHELMLKSELNTGSFDILVDENNEYYFLEVNPVGQFGMVSSPCNYYLEKKVAQYLLSCQQI
jgi:ATP-GRASP peptide maturase of grasp-with-spasm system